MLLSSLDPELVVHNHERRWRVRDVLGHGLRLTAAGVGLGLAGALAGSHLLQTLLFGVRPTDALTFCVVSAVLGAVALAASYLPARRASRVDPMVALRYE